MKNNASIEKKIWISFTAILITILAIISMVMSSRSNTLLSEDENIKNKYKKLNLLVEEAVNYVNENYVNERKVNQKKLYYGAIQGLYEATGSKWNSFFDERRWDDLWNDLSGEFTGIGVYIKEDKFKKGIPIIVEVIADSPAEKNKLLPRDRIIKIDGYTTAEKNYKDNLDKIQGEKGTTVILTIKRNENDILDIALKRDTIHTKTIEYAKINKETAYIKIRRFSLGTDKELTDAFADLYSKGFENLLIDLRGNPGGVFDTALKICDKFIDSGIICSTKGRRIFDNNTYEAHKYNTEYRDKPMVILIDKGSASASEIFAGAMKDHKRAVLVGEKTYGKGVVASVMPLDSSDSKIGVTVVIQKYFTPKGIDINELGIHPDVVAEFPEYTDSDIFYMRKIIYENEINLIARFISNNEDISDESIIRFKGELAEKGYFVNFYPLKREIVLEQKKYKKNIFNPEIDPQLKKAVEILNEPTDE